MKESLKHSRTGKLKVSVLMTAYNHEDFAQQAVKGVLDQQTDFDVELVIGEDCSTDRTREILSELAEQNPGRIRLILQKQNVGMLENFITVFNQCDGDYVAQLCGDDYWTDPHKLQQQVDLLEANPDCVICHTNALRTWPENPTGVPAWTPGEKPSRTSLAQMMATNQAITSSNLFRGGIIKELPDWFHDLPFSDWALQLLLAQHGDALYIDKLTCVYRLHDGSWSRRPSTHVVEGRIKVASIVGPNLPVEHQSTMARSLQNYRRDLIDVWLQQGDIDKAAAYSDEHDCQAAFKRLRHFYRGVELSGQGKRFSAMNAFIKSSCHGWGKTRIGFADIAIAAAQTALPRTYAAARGLVRRLRSK